MFLQSTSVTTKEIAKELRGAFETISTHTTMTREAFAHEYQKSGIEGVRELAMWSQVAPWDESITRTCV